MLLLLSVKQLREHTSCDCNALWMDHLWNQWCKYHCRSRIL